MAAERLSARTDTNTPWVAEVFYRTLGYYFSVRWNQWPTGDVGALVRRVFGAFEVAEDVYQRRNPPTPGLPWRYTLHAAGPSARARFRLYLSGTELIRSDRMADVLHHLFWHVNSETIRQTGDFLLLHAGAVVGPGGGTIVLPGTSGSGKSTLVGALVHAGFDYQSDEIAAIDPVHRVVHPYPKALTLKTRFLLDRLGMTQALPDEHWLAGRAWHIPAQELRPAAVGRAAPLLLVIFPSHQPGQPTRCTPLAPAATLARLLDNTMNLDRYRSRALHLLAAALERARGYELVSGELDEAVAAVSDCSAAARQSARTW